MEKSLLDKIHNRTMDEVDKDMVAARCKNACDQIFNTASECIEKLDKVCKEFDDEIHLMGISLVLTGQIKAFHREDKELECGLIIGTTKNVSEILDTVKGDLKR